MDAEAAEANDRAVKLAERTAEKAKLNTTNSAIREIEHVRTAAASPECLDGEIAKLRETLERYVAKDNVELIIKVVDAVRRAVVSRYQISRKAEEDLAAGIASVARGLRAQWYSEASDDEA